MKVLEVLSKTPDIPDSVKKLLPGFTQGLGNPNVSLSEQAANANMLTNIFGAVLSSGLKTTMENSADNAAARYANAVTESQGRDFSMINEVSPTAKLRGQQLAANLAKTKSETFENLANRTKPVALSYSTADDARKAGEAANPGLVVEVKPAPGGGFTFNSGQALLPNKEAEGRLESFNKEIDRLVLTGESARQVAPAVESLLGSLESGSLKTGFAEGAKAKMRSVGKSIGFPVDETALANTEQATAMFGQMILQYYDRTKGGISNAENVLFQSFGPEIGKSEAANKAILTFSKKRGQLDRNLEGIARSYRMGEINQKEAQKQISSTYKKYDEDITSLIPDSPAATPDKYVVGQTYKDANGNTAVYQGKGVFK
jgi:hypothetical protein